LRRKNKQRLDLAGEFSLSFLWKTKVKYFAWADRGVVVCSRVSLDSTRCFTPMGFPKAARFLPFYAVNLEIGRWNWNKGRTGRRRINRIMVPPTPSPDSVPQAA